MKIKPLDLETLKDAISLKIKCWTEELQGKAANNMDFDETYTFWSHWMQSSLEDQDQRTLIGAFDDQNLIGCIFLSLAEASDCEDAVEINGLFVDESHRGKYISYQLMQEGLSTYQQKYVIIYNHHYAPSHGFYVHLGGQILRSEVQMDGKLEVDVFIFDKENLVKRVHKKLEVKQ